MILANSPNHGPMILATDNFQAASAAGVAPHTTEALLSEVVCQGQAAAIDDDVRHGQTSDSSSAGASHGDEQRERSHMWVFDDAIRALSLRTFAECPANAPRRSPCEPSDDVNNGTGPADVADVDSAEYLGREFLGLCNVRHSVI